MRRTRPRLLAGASLGAAAAATAAALLLSSAASPPPAFAVTRHHDGSVAVKINRKSGIAGANRRLAAMGIHARVLAVADDQSAPRCVASGTGQNPHPGPGVIITVFGPGASNTGTVTGIGNTGTGTGVTVTGNTGPKARAPAGTRWPAHPDRRGS